MTPHIITRTFLSRNVRVRCYRLCVTDLWRTESFVRLSLLGEIGALASSGNAKPVMAITQYDGGERTLVRSTHESHVCGCTAYARETEVGVPRKIMTWREAQDSLCRGEDRCR